MDETGSGSCQMIGFGISGVEPSGSATRQLLISKMDLREIVCEDGRWMDLAQDRVKRQTSVLAAFNFIL